MDIASESRKAVSELFGDSEEISRISELPGIDREIAEHFLENGIDFIEDFLALSEEGLSVLKGISADQIEELRKLIEEFVEIVEDEESPEAEQAAGEILPEETEEYECPECGAKITVDMTTCPNCGIGLSFEFEE
jgi:N utilization substance protein A